LSSAAQSRSSLFKEHYSVQEAFKKDLRTQSMTTATASSSKPRPQDDVPAPKKPKRAA
jgi:hypothetical protein